MPFKSIGMILLAGFLLGFGAVPVSRLMADEPPSEYTPMTAHLMHGLH
jgi:hypothetical protein